MSDQPSTAYIALGSNLGDRRANINAALNHLRKIPGIEIIKVSTLLENPAIGGPQDSPPFLNAAAEIHTTLSPRKLLERLLEIEREQGRQRREKWGPRLIDLDILLYGEEVIAEPDLQIPHPLMHERAFVLKPLAEIAPTASHPVLRKSISALLSKLKAN